jgi:hypothetical protein
MQSKSNKKTAASQAPAQTPEQKKIEQLEKQVRKLQTEKRSMYSALEYNTLKCANETLKMQLQDEKHLKTACFHLAKGNGTMAEVAMMQTDYWMNECKRLESAKSKVAQSDTREKSKDQSCINLICIKPGALDVTYPDGARREVVDMDLDHLARYTATKVVKDTDGLLCYSIKELGGALKLADRFHVSTEKSLPNSQSSNL